MKINHKNPRQTGRYFAWSLPVDMSYSWDHQEICGPPNYHFVGHWGISRSSCWTEGRQSGGNRLSPVMIHSFQ